MDNNVRLPAEWEPQDGVMLTWPHDGGDWVPYLEQVEPVFSEIAIQVARREHLLVVYRDAVHRQHIESLLTETGVDMQVVRLYSVESNDTWARDHGPITIKRDDQWQLCDFTFDGWGGKYPAQLDNRITRSLHGQGAFGSNSIETIKMVLEGGAIETNGQGTLLAVRRCVLDTVRNPTITQETMESELTRVLGIKRFLWLDNGGLVGDDTDSHVDTLARFGENGAIIYQACDDADDLNYPGLKAMEQELSKFQNHQGKPYPLVALPSPSPIYNAEGDQLPASYANFLIINGAVLVPVYDDPADEVVLKRLAQCFPQREIIGINCRPLILQYGSLHCVTMQLPKGVLTSSHPGDSR